MVKDTINPSPFHDLSDSLRSPWQYEWKNPTLKQIYPFVQNGPDDSNKPARAISAAKLTQEEFENCIEHLNNVKEGSQEHRISSQSIGILTIKLLNNEDSLLLELLDGTSSKVISRTHLYWPSSALPRDHGGNFLRIKTVVLCRCEEKATTHKNPEKSFISLRRQKYYTARAPSGTKQQLSERAIGSDFELKHQYVVQPSISDAAEDLSDALDTIRLLSLGIGLPANSENETYDVASSSMNQIPGSFSMETAIPSEGSRSSDDNERRYSEDKPSEDESEEYDSPMNLGAESSESMHEEFHITECLKVCVVENSGTLHWYNALDLFNHAPNEKSLNNNKIASYFLGSLFDTAEKFVLPLAQPHRTTNLSIALENLDRNIISKHKLLRPWIDLDTLNADIEPTSNDKVTIGNRIECIVSTREYLVIGGSGTTNRVLKQSHERIDTSTEETAADDEVSTNGGWLTFVSLKAERNFQESRTIFLPFAMHTMHYERWNGMDLLFIVKKPPSGSCSMKKFESVFAIRMDTGLVSVPCQNKTPRSSLYSSLADMFDDEIASHSKKNDETGCFVKIRRFELIPLQLDEPYMEEASDGMFYDDPNITNIGFCDGSDPPSVIISLKSQSIRQVELHSMSHFELNAGWKNGQVYIKCERKHGHVAQIDVASVYESTGSFCFGGQGWSIVSSKSDFLEEEQFYFICWEGEKEAQMSYVRKIPSSTTSTQKLQPSEVPLMICYLLASDTSKFQQSRREIIGKNIPNNSSISPHVSSLQTFERVHERLIPHGGTATVCASCLSDIEEIQHNLFWNSIQLIVDNHDSVSRNELATMLLESVETWTSLDESMSSEKTGEKTNVYVQAVSIVIQSHSGFFSFALRSPHKEVSNLSHRHESGVPFEMVLSWLCRQRKNYRMAAYIALLLMGDLECAEKLRHTVSSKLNACALPRDLYTHILDGIQPLEISELAIGTDVNSFQEMRITNSKLLLLADLTVTCLVKCRSETLPVLLLYLRRNTDYDPCKACVVLIAVFAKILGHIKELDPDLSDMLWPINALLQLASARYFLDEALILLNMVAPSELRGLNAEMGLSKPLSLSLVKLIVASDPSASRSLLSLQTEDKRFWGSITLEMQYSLSVVYTGVCFPLLKENEVRNWALEVLQRFITDKEDPLGKDFPVTWLQSMCHACMTNANVNWKVMAYTDPSPFDDRNNSEIIDNTTDLDEYICLVEKEKNLAQLAFSGHDSSHDSLFDFDICISCLLILELIHERWHEQALVSSRALLNYLCSRSGIRQHSLFNKSKLLKLCWHSGNAEAAAGIIGGKKGLVLTCCSVLHSEFPSFSISEAEMILLQNSVELPIISQSSSRPFSPSVAHKIILQLMNEHVLSITKFADFDTCIMHRRRVDPIFACRICLRMWYLLNGRSEQASVWLTRWLRRQVGIVEGSSDSRRNSLACAAICRAALWPAESEMDLCIFSAGVEKHVMAEVLELDSSFLIDLAESCLGLIETLPLIVRNQVLHEKVVSNE